MRVLRSASASRTTLASLGALYLLVVALTVVLINRVLAEPFEFGSGFSIVLVGLGIMFPVGLLVVLALNLVRLLRDRHERRPGSGFKTRLTGFFALVVFLAAVPQGIVSVSFLSAGLDLLFRSNAAEAVSRSLDLALDYYEDQVRDLRVAAEEGAIEAIIAAHSVTDGVAGGGDVGGDTDGAGAVGAVDSAAAGQSASVDPLLIALRRRVPHAAAVQLFDPTGQELYFSGDTTFARGARPGGAIAAADATVTRIVRGGEPVLEAVTPIDPGGAGPAVAVVTARLPAGLDETARMLTEVDDLYARFAGVRSAVLLVLTAVYGVFAAPTLLMSIMAGFFLSDRIMRPIESLEEATRRVADGDYSVRILTPPGGDLGVLVVSFNRMVTELDRARRRMAQAEKVQAWQEIAQRLAHEVKNPLTPIRLAAERLRRRYEAGAPDFGDVLGRTVDTIVREVDALTSLLNEFRSFSRLPEPQIARVPVRELIEEVAAVYGDHPSVAVDSAAVPPGLMIGADRGQMRQVFTNLFANAVEASGGSVSIAVSAHEIQRGGETICRIRVEDDGPGIPADLRESLFEPYVTSKSRGTGLGLAIVERIVFDHDGRISFESAPGSGTTFVLDLPVEHHP